MSQNEAGKKNNKKNHTHSHTSQSYNKNDKHNWTTTKKKRKQTMTTNIKSYCEKKVATRHYSTQLNALLSKTCKERVMKTVSQQKETLHTDCNGRRMKMKDTVMS